MKSYLLHANILIGLMMVTLSGCTSTPSMAPVAEDGIIAREIIGRWIRDETYPYGRFVGVTTFRADGTGRRDFGIIKNWQTGGTEITPLLLEDFSWKVAGGYIQFFDYTIKDLDPESPTHLSIKKGKNEQEFVTELAEKILKTKDPRNKIDSYIRYEQ